MGKIKINFNPTILGLYIVALTSSLMLLTSEDNMAGIVELSRPIQYLYVFSILFIPGLLILSSLGYREEDFITTVLFSLGISIFFITTVCLFSNLAFPILGITPVKKESLTISILLAFLALSIVSVKKTNKVSLLINYDLFSTLLGFTLILSTLIGTLNLEHSNFLILWIFLIFSMLPILVHYNFVQKEGFPFIIWAFALSLITYNSIFGAYIRPTDNIYEIFIIKEFVLKRGVWEPFAPSNILAMPNVMLFVPFLSFFSDGFINTYKFIIPFIASFIPLAVYKSSELKYNHEIAFYSSYFFSSLFVYFTWTSITAKMTFAGLFLALIALTILKSPTSSKEKLLLALFSVALVFSHYGTSAILGIGLSLSYLFLLLAKYETRLKGFTIFYLVLFYIYSLSVAKGSIFESVTLTVINMIKGITDILSSRNYGSELLLASVPLYLEILRDLYIIAFVFGLLEGIYITWKNKKMVDEYFIISMTLLALIPVPYIFPVGQYAGGRAWFIPAIFVAPLLVAGSTKFGKLLRTNGKTNKIIVIFLFAFFIFNSGLAAEVIWKHNVSASVYISYPRIVKEGEIWEREYLDRVSFEGGDLISALWLSSTHKGNSKIYTGRNAVLNLVYVGFSRGDVEKVIGSRPNICLIQTDTHIEKGSYVYLTKFNTQNGLIKIGGRLKPELAPLGKIMDFKKLSKIYTNGGSEIYYR